MSHLAPQNLRSFQSLIQIMSTLRGPGGCPWDLEQNHLSLVKHAIEEAHELAEAIESQDEKAMIEELGDVLLQVVFHAELGRQEARFNIEDVIEGICTKLVRRHPHVFSDVGVSDSTEVLQNWEKIKAKEKGTTQKEELLGGPLHLPALLRAQKIGEKTKRRKFDWEKPEQVFEKLQEEMRELKVELDANNKVQALEELGDLLFTAAQLARHLEADAEQTLRGSNRKFESRYQKMLGLVDRDGKDWDTLTLIQKDEYWQKAKKL